MKVIDDLICKIMSNPTVSKMAENKAIGFFVETFTRLAAKKPVYWKIVQGISFAIYIWNNIPVWLAANSIAVPSLFTVWQNKTAGILGLAGVIIAQLTTQSKIIGTDTTGAPIKQTDQDTMPFTSATETKSIPVSGKEKEAVNQP